MGLKAQIYVDFQRPLEVCGLVGGRELILVDANVLIFLANNEGADWVRKLIVDWKSFGARAVCGICDFIEREALNAEKWKIGGRKVHGFLSSVAKSGNGMYVELKTPIEKVAADSRDLFAETLPKSLRSILMKAGKAGLSGTDKCLLMVALHLKNNAVGTSILTSDRLLTETCNLFNVKVRL